MSPGNTRTSAGAAGRFRWLLGLALAGLAAAVVIPLGSGPSADGALARAMVRRGRTVVVSARPFAELPKLSGTTWVALGACPNAQPALAGVEGPAVAKALDGCRADSLLVLGALPAWAGPESIAAGLRQYQTSRGLVGRHLARDHALYAHDPVSGIPPAQQEALAVVARRLLAGERPPRLSSFPAPLRAVAHVEVMVLLKRGSRPRLWRSARGTSIARAFLTAVRVARKRWDERAAAMGGPLDGALDDLTVSVALLQDDGEFGTRTDAFVDSVVTDQHGVAFDHKGSWRYRLPAATAEHERPSLALAQLLSENALGTDALGRSEVRPYRMRVRELGRSLPPPPPADGLGAVADPSEVTDATPTPEVE